jgi:hypothetical protein
VIRVPGKVQADTGDIIHMTWEPGRTHWFELSTGHRVDSQA